MTISKVMTMSQINNICSHLINKNILRNKSKYLKTMTLTTKSRISCSNNNSIDLIRVKSYRKNQAKTTMSWHLRKVCRKIKTNNLLMNRVQKCTIITNNQLIMSFKMIPKVSNKYSMVWLKLTKQKSIGINTVI